MEIREIFLLAFCSTVPVLALWLAWLIGEVFHQRKIIRELQKNLRVFREAVNDLSEELGGSVVVVLEEGQKIPNQATPEQAAEIERTRRTLRSDINRSRRQR